MPRPYQFIRGFNTPHVLRLDNNMGRVSYESCAALIARLLPTQNKEKKQAVFDLVFGTLMDLARNNDKFLFIDVQEYKLVFKTIPISKPLDRIITTTNKIFSERVICIKHGVQQIAYVLKTLFCSPELEQTKPIEFLQKLIPQLLEPYQGYKLCWRPRGQTLSLQPSNIGIGWRDEINADDSYYQNPPEVDWPETLLESPCTF